MSVESPETEAPLAPAMSEALRKARLAEAAHFDAAADIRDAKTLRLTVLLDELRPHLAGIALRGGHFIDPVVMPGEPPRLWIDMVSYVLMEPDPRTYRLQRDTAGGHEILLETRDRREMHQHIITYAAHRLVERERQFAFDARTRQPAGKRYGGTALFLAWLSGFSVGVLALFALGIWMAKNPF
jgi:hypothetical protein